MTAKSQPQPGINGGGWRAQFDAQCVVCDQPITARVTFIVMRKGRPVHIGCVNGADDR